MLCDADRPWGAVSAVNGAIPDVWIVNDEAAARALVSDGVCPIEAAYGVVSVVDELGFDHHGELSHLEPVAVRAWRDHYGVRADDPRFLVAGQLDADASFAMASLAGLVPGPHDPEADRVRTIVDTIGIIDSDPIGRDLTTRPGFAEIWLWSTLFSTGRPHLARQAVQGWGVITRRDPAMLRPLLDAVAADEQNRRFQAEQDAQRSLYTSSDGRLTVLDRPARWGFDVWYGRDEDQAAENPAAWRRQVVMIRSEAGTVTVGCPNKAVAERLFGNGGLRNVYPTLQPPGWGGREAVGGSPRGRGLSEEESVTAARMVTELLP